MVAIDTSRTNETAMSLMPGQEPFNPFAAPETLVAPEHVDPSTPDQAERMAADAARVGIPWEQSGNLVRRFISTIWQFHRRPVKTFRDMRREGSLLMPVVFGQSVNLFVLAAHFSFAIGMGAESIWTYTNANSGREWVLWEVIGVSLFFGIVVIIQGFLLITGGAAWGLRGTARVMFYSLGVTGCWSIVPSTGDLIGFILWIMLFVIGLSEVQTVTRWRALFALAVAFLTITIGMGIGMTVLEALGVVELEAIDS